MSNQKSEVQYQVEVEIEALVDLIKHVESIVIICNESILLHAIPEMQNTGDVLESLFQPLYEGKLRAEALEKKISEAFAGGAEHE